MSIIAVYNDIKNNNKLYKLTINGKVAGIRACVYNWQDKSYEYFDFDISFIRNKEIQKFINQKRSSFQSLELIPYNGLYMSKQEINQGIVVKEFKDAEMAEKVLYRFIEVYK